jgi:hypothetical protein
MAQPAGKFRKKPVVIEAMPFDGTQDGAVAILDWADQTVQMGSSNTLVIKTLEGEMTVSPGDWVIRGVQGEFYPIKDLIFVETYEPVDD